MINTSIKLIVRLMCLKLEYRRINNTQFILNPLLTLGIKFTFLWTIIIIGVSKDLFWFNNLQYELIVEGNFQFSYILSIIKQLFKSRTAVINMFQRKNKLKQSKKYFSFVYFKIQDNARTEKRDKISKLFHTSVEIICQSYIRHQLSNLDNTWGPCIVFLNLGKSLLNRWATCEMIIGSSKELK